MKRFIAALGILSCAALSSARGQAQPASYATMAPAAQYMMASRTEEIALARTAAPPSISADADVLVLGPRGYETAAKGRNGFVCFVERSWAARFTDPEFWNPKSRSPNCFNPAAVRTVLPQLLKLTQWVLAGATREEVVARTKSAADSGTLAAPAPGAMSYMLSKQGYLGDAAAGPWLPHVMLFVRHGDSDAWGASLDGSPLIGVEGNAFESSIVLIPVRRWSDGSPAPAPAMAGATGGPAPGE